MFVILTSYNGSFSSLARGALEYQGGDIRLIQKFMLLGLFFRTRQCTHVHRLGVQKRAKLEKKGCVFGPIDKFWKGHDRQIKKNACKNAYLGSIFIPEKYVIRVLFVSPWTSLIPLLPFECPTPWTHKSC